MAKQLHRQAKGATLSPCPAFHRRLTSFQCLGCGRPPIFNSISTNCELPFDYDVIIEEDGTEIESGKSPIDLPPSALTISPTVWHWRYSFCRDVLMPFVELMSSAKPVKYSQVLEYDKEWRAYPMHPYCTRAPAPKAGISLGVEPLMSMHQPMVSYYLHHGNRKADCCHL